jgi:hypothetical protein
MSNLLRSTVHGVERRPDDGVDVQPMVPVHAVEGAPASVDRVPGVVPVVAGWRPRAKDRNIRASMESMSHTLRVLSASVDGSLADSEGSDGIHS